MTDRLGDLARPGVEDVDGVQERIDTIHNVPFVQFSGAPLAPATFGSILAVFLSLLLSSIGLISGEYNNKSEIIVIIMNSF